VPAQRCAQLPLPFLPPARPLSRLSLSRRTTFSPSISSPSDILPFYLFLSSELAAASSTRSSYSQTSSTSQSASSPLCPTSSRKSSAPPLGQREWKAWATFVLVRLTPVEQRPSDERPTSSCSNRTSTVNRNPTKGTGWAGGFVLAVCKFEIWGIISETLERRFGEQDGQPYGSRISSRPNLSRTLAVLSIPSHLMENHTHGTSSFLKPKAHNDALVLTKFRSIIQIGRRRGVSGDRCHAHEQRGPSVHHHLPR
jgi:hypothetical protein